GPGRIDPFNPVKFRMLELPDDGTIGNSDMMPVWNEDEHNGFAYHWDGLETSLTETAQTGALGDGATLKSIDLEGIDRVEQFMRDYQPPAYPFPIDVALADQGKQVFDTTCASCHAFGGERTGTVIPIDEIGTDRHRLDMWTQSAVDAYSAYADGYSYDFQELQKTDGYVAVALDGLWLRAPYLHNGSVPYLPDLLETPENRTPQFYRGYDVYDPDKVGFTAEGPDAAEQGILYDTTVTANSNEGHLYGIDLPTEQKAALVEYLKTL
ncbi:MAG: c-type cytochrome, partial [Merismopedia sp. SIO2A8]|nr:c-type cytochrome [Merismopedia sp. SIO2A8]